LRIALAENLLGIIKKEVPQGKNFGGKKFWQEENLAGLAEFDLVDPENI